MEQHTLKFAKKQMRTEVEVFLEQIVKVGSELTKLYNCWEELDMDESDTASEGYPFKQDLLEFIADYWNWYYQARDNFAKQVLTFKPTLTVSDLKKILDSFSDDTQIVVAKEGGDDWLNITELEIPDGESMFTLTLHTKDNFNTWQFGV